MRALVGCGSPLAESLNPRRRRRELRTLLARNQRAAEDVRGPAPPDGDPAEGGEDEDAAETRAEQRRLLEEAVEILQQCQEDLNATEARLLRCARPAALVPAAHPLRPLCGQRGCVMPLSLSFRHLRETGPAPRLPLSPASLITPLAPVVESFQDVVAEFARTLKVSPGAREAAVARLREIEKMAKRYGEGVLGAAAIVQSSLRGLPTSHHLD